LFYAGACWLGFFYLTCNVRPWSSDGKVPKNTKSHLHLIICSKEQLYNKQPVNSSRILKDHDCNFQKESRSPSPHGRYHRVQAQ
jgi:hypothetical protein